MQAVEIVLAVAQQQRRRLGLSGCVAFGNEYVQDGREATGFAERRTPFVGNCGEWGIQRGTQLCDRLRQRVAQVLVFAAAEIVPLHHHAAPEPCIVMV